MLSNVLQLVVPNTPGATYKKHSFFYFMALEVLEPVMYKFQSVTQGPSASQDLQFTSKLIQ